MGNKWNHMDSKDGGHPNNIGQYTYIHPPALDVDRYMTAIAMSTLTAGDDLVNDGAWINSIMVGTPHTILFTTSLAITLTITIRGINQFSEEVTEQIVWAADAADLRTVNAYRRISSIIVDSVTTSANTLSVGNSLTGIRMALPIKITRSVEVVGINTGAAGGHIANMLVDTQYALIYLSSGALTNAPHIVAYELDAIGNRG